MAAQYGRADAVKWALEWRAELMKEQQLDSNVELPDAVRRENLAEPNFNDFNQYYRYSGPVETKLVLSLPVTDFRPEAMRVTERKAANGIWFEVETFNETRNQWIDQKNHPIEADAIRDANGWYPQPAMSLKEEQKVDTKVIVIEGSLGIFDIAIEKEDGTVIGQIGKKTLEEIAQEHPGKAVSIDTMGNAIDRQNQAMTSPAETISEEHYNEMLEVLPPLGWVSNGKDESFKMCEMTCGNITGIYARIEDKYFKMSDVVTLKHNDILAKCAVASKSLDEAQQIASDKRDYEHIYPGERAATFDGKIMGVTERHVVMSLGIKAAIFTKSSLETVPAVNDEVTITSRPYKPFLVSVRQQETQNDLER